ncbi:hypothetical protein [Micromonospora zhanjiangensis]|uniref:LPXTG-motif cell wall anchor domain-containing protein n=1 Tax=Micromonospora zhanjiangensis TaxID=1522057 RepID=A0ABV8KGY3_9ACTN
MTRLIRSSRRPLAALGAAIAAVVAVLAGVVPAHAASETTLRGFAVCESGQWSIFWTLTNGEDVAGTVTKVKPTPPDSRMYDLAAGTVLPAGVGSSLTGIQKTRGGVGRANARLTVEVSWKRDNGVTTRQLTGSVDLRQDCLPRDPALPNVTFTSRCDRILLITLANGGQTNNMAYFVVTADNPKYTAQKFVGPGKSFVISWPADAGRVTVKETSESRFVWRGRWTRPGNCGGAGGSPGDGAHDGEALPVTGPAVGVLLTGATLSLAVGVALILLTRRRRVRLTD